jgi:hypothetical protein
VSAKALSLLGVALHIDLNSSSPEDKEHFTHMGKQYLGIR